MSAIDTMANEGGWDPEYKPILWARFRDDIYIPWTHGLDKLNAFHTWLNFCLPGIKFTMTTPSSHGTEFLDTFIYMNNFELHTKPYSKDCDEHTFLVPSSCHPTHNLKNIPYSIAHRIHRIASENEEYEKSKTEYSNYLRARG